jgi:hypothetical protein
MSGLAFPKTDDLDTENIRTILLEPLGVAEPRQRCHPATHVVYIAFDGRSPFDLPGS